MIRIVKVKLDVYIQSATIIPELMSVLKVRMNGISGHLIFILISLFPQENVHADSRIN